MRSPKPGSSYRWRRRTCSPTRCSRTAASRATTARFAATRCARSCATSTLLSNLARRLMCSGVGARAYDGPRRFDYKPLRTEDTDGVWASAAANMTTYLLLKERAIAFRADPEVQAALAAARVAELAIPTLGEGESYTNLLEDRSAFEDFDIEAAGKRGYHFTQLDQLAVEHVLGAR